MGKTVDIGGRLHSTEQGNVVAGANEIYDDTKGKKQDVINGEVDAALEGLDQSKQDNLTFDQTPTESSTNPVTSGGVYVADLALQQAIEAILLLIPSAASALNQLADKSFVNSSIATASATFRGTYNLVSDLHLSVTASHQDIAMALASAVSSADNNDYCFVQIPTSDTSSDIRVTERYKFNGTVWAYEYDLNNSGFTATQWEAINSGITALLVTKLGALPTAAELATLLAGKQNVLTFDNVPVSGSDNPVKSGGLYQLFTAIDAKFPSDASANNKLVAENRLAAYVTAIIEALDASFDLTSADGHVTFRMTQTNGVIASVQILTSDIASASALTALGGRVSTNETDIANLQAAYAGLTQSDIVVVNGALPSSGQQQNVIYRQPDPDHTPPQFYSDYMWNGSTWVLMATYNNAIDAVPTANSNNLVESGGVYSMIAVSDIQFDEIGYIGEGGIVYPTSEPWRRTDTIPVFPGSIIRGRVYKSLNATMYIAFYDKDYHYVSGYMSDETGMADFRVVVPIEASYARLTTKKTNVEESYVKIDQIQQINEIISPIVDIDDYSDSLTMIGYLDTGGVFYNQGGGSWVSSDYIDIIGNSRIIASLRGQVGATSLISFYDKNKQYISSILPYISEEQPVNVLAPVNAAYMRACNYVAQYTAYYLYVLSNKVDKLVYEKIKDVKYKYNNNLHKPYVFNGKQAAFFGDSVTYGVYSDSQGVHVGLNNCYRAHLCEMLNMTGTNYAVSGTFICDPENSQDSILNQVLNIISVSSEFDYIFIAGGINDFWTGKPLGILGDSTYATFYGALKVMCEHLNTVLSGKDTHVIFLIPINYSKSVPITNVAELNDYRNAIFEIATMYGYEVLDTSVIGFPNEKDDNIYKQTLIYDGVHPTIFGHKMMAYNLVSILL